jgi:multidrug efflux pump subunit AcrA (membrane-fusion protein)
MAGIKRKRRWGFWVFLVLVIGGIVAYVKTRPEEKLKVTAQTLKRGSVAVSVAPISAGEIYPKARATIASEAFGKIKELRKRKGDTVVAGEVIAVLDLDDLKTRLTQAQAQVLAAKSVLRQSNLRTDAAKTAFARTDELVKQGASSQTELERIDSELALSTESITSAQAQLQLAQTTVVLAKQALEKTEIKAPFSGILADPPSLTGTISLGSSGLPTINRVEPGSQVSIGTPLYEVIDFSETHIIAAFDELDAGRIHINSVADLKFDALPGVTDIKGTITALDPTFIKDSNGARMRLVTISLPKDPRLVVGMSVDIEIEVERKDNVLVLPSHLIAGRGVKRTVWVIESDRLVKKEVALGLVGWTSTEIVGGLEEGALIVNSLDVEGLEEGVLVEHTMKEEKPNKETVSVKATSSQATP